MTYEDVAQRVLRSLVKKSGAREWDDLDARGRLIEAALEMTDAIFGIEPSEPGETMPTKILVQEMDGTPPQILFRDVTDFSPTAANDLRKGSPTTVQLDLTSLAATPAGRQSDKFDLGENRAEQYHPRLAWEGAATPTAGRTIDLYVAPSSTVTAGTGNAGGVVGADGAFAGYSSNLAAALKQLTYVGSFIVTTQATGTIQIIECTGDYFPKERYGTLVLVNDSGSAGHSDAVEMHVVLDPVVPEIQ